jgi:hypothetical protein
VPHEHLAADGDETGESRDEQHDSKTETQQFFEAEPLEHGGLFSPREVTAAPAESAGALFCLSAQKPES